MQPPAVATRRAHAAELRCTATKLDLETSCELEASDLQEFTSTLTHSKVVFVKMYQGRCRQCIALAPKFKSLAQEHSRSGEVVFMKVSPATLPTPLHEHLPASLSREFKESQMVHVLTAELLSRSPRTGFGRLPSTRASRGRPPSRRMSTAFSSSKLCAPSSTRALSLLRSCGCQMLLSSHTIPVTRFSISLRTSLCQLWPLKRVMALRSFQSALVFQSALGRNVFQPPHAHSAL